MSFEKIKYFVFIFALISLSLLLFSIYFFSPQTYSVSEFLIVDSYDVVTLFGSVRNIKNTNTTYFFNLCDGSKCLECVFFNPSIHQKQLLISDNLIRVTGKLEGKFLVYKIENG